MNYNDKPLKIFMKYVWQQKKLFLLDMGCALFVGAVDLIFPFVSRRAMSTFLPQGLFRVFFIAMGAILLAYILRFFGYYIITVLGHRMGVLVEAEMRRDLFAHMQQLSFSFYDKNRTGVLLSRITSDLFDVTELSHHGPENIVICFITIVGAMIMMAFVNWKLTLVLAVLLPLCIWFTLSQRDKMHTANTEVKKKTAVITSAIESGISGVRTSKAFANDEIELQKFDRANEIFKTAKKGYYNTMGLYMSGMEFTISIMLVAVITVGGWLIMKGQMDYIDLVTFTLYVSAFSSPIRKLTQFSEIFMAGTAGFSRFLEIMRTEPEIQDSPDAVSLKNVSGRVEYRHVSFCYDNQIPVLDDICLLIEPGKYLAVVGASGGGKTTLCQLLPRFYEATAGEVLVDGTDIRHFTQKSLRENIGIIQQDVFMFAGTIKENILYGRPDATDDEIMKAAKLACIHDEIMQLPDGYDTYIGERGVMLSGGQKQRISIARVFLKNPRILILDEATSALDTVTETEIQDSLDRLSIGRTTIIIAHRLSTIRRADSIAVIEDNRIAELGTHDELLAKDGIYAKLYRAQAGF